MLRPRAYQIGAICAVRTQIAIRLPDEIVVFIDDEVQGEHARSHAARTALDIDCCDLSTSPNLTRLDPSWFALARLFVRT